MLQQALACFNLQKLPLVSRRSIFTHQTNTTSSVGYSPLSTEITPLSFHFLRGVRRSTAARPALPPLLPLCGRDGGDTAETEEQVWPRAGAGGGVEGKGGVGSRAPCPRRPRALLSPRESSPLRPSGVMDGGRCASLWGSALLGFTS